MSRIIQNYLFHTWLAPPQLVNPIDLTKVVSLSSVCYLSYSVQNLPRENLVKCPGQFRSIYFIPGWRYPQLKCWTTVTHPKMRNSAGRPKTRDTTGCPKVLHNTTRPKMRNSAGRPKIRNTNGYPRVLNYTTHPKMVNSGIRLKMRNSPVAQNFWTILLAENAWLRWSPENAKLHWLPKSAAQYYLPENA